MHRARILLPLSFALVLSACGDSGSGRDVGNGDGSTRDVGFLDFGVRDSGLPDTGARDTGGRDTGVGDLGGPDLGDPDLGIGDAGVGTGSDGIRSARALPDGPTSFFLEGVWVTYIKPNLGNDVGGYFVQAEADGPALFIVDTSSQSANLQVGDEVSLTITAMDTSAGLRQASESSAPMVTSTGNDVTTLTQDVTTATGTAALIADKESELIMITVTATTNFAFGGSGYSSADIQTALITGDPGFELRIPETLQNFAGFEAGCTFTVRDTPLWRFNEKAQVSAWELADFESQTCPPVRVESAVAVDPTTVVVTFSRNLEATTVVDGAFSFDNGLTAVVTTVADNTVTLTTSLQTNVDYTLTVANTVEDVLGYALDANNNSATFSGLPPPAVLRVNELKGNVTGGCDLIELRVISGGTLDGIEVFERGSAIVTFTGLALATNDLVVVHLDATDPNCNPGTSGNETAGPAEFPVATYGNNFDTAYDWYSADSGLTATDNVITVYDADGVIQDAVFVSDAPVGTAAAATEAQAADVAMAGEWTMVGGGIPAGGFVDDDFNAHAVQDLNAADTIQRIDDGDDNDRDDWSATNQTATFGLLNVGQNPL